MGDENQKRACDASDVRRRRGSGSVRALGGRSTARSYNDHTNHVHQLVCSRSFVQEYLHAGREQTSQKRVCGASLAGAPLFTAGRIDGERVPLGLEAEEDIRRGVVWFDSHTCPCPGKP